jgi:hypothetical protein
LSLSGNYSITGKIVDIEGNKSMGVHTQRRDHFSFPSRIFTSFEERPRNDNIQWIMMYRNIILNLNDGNKYVSGYIIPPEANATEFFEEYTFQVLREPLEMISSLGRWIESTAPFYKQDDAIFRDNVQNATDCVEKSLLDWQEGLEPGDMDYFHHFLVVYANNGDLIPSIKPVQIDGWTVELLYTNKTDRLDIVSSCHDMIINLSFSGLVTGKIGFHTYLLPIGWERLDMGWREW